MNRFEHLESFQNDRVVLSVYQAQDPLQNSYWIGSGAAEIELKEDDLVALYQILDAYYEGTEVYITKRRRFNWIHACLLIYLIMPLLTILLIIGV